MIKILLMINFLFISLYARIENKFFVIDNEMTLECKDVNKLKKINNQMVQVIYTKSGRKKINTFSTKNLNKKFGLIAGNTVIFLNMKISTPLASEDITSPSIEFYSKSGQINKFIDTFKHCNLHP